jgi:hypothetical protein
LQLSAYLNSPDSCLSTITGTVKIRVTNPTMTARGAAKFENTSPSEGPTTFAVPPKINAAIETGTLYTRKGIYRSHRHRVSLVGGPHRALRRDRSRVGPS